MRADRWLLIGYLACASGLSGCHLPHNDGSVPAELVKSRNNSQKAAEAIEHSRWDEAETLLAQALKTCPKDTEARCYYAETLWHRGAGNEALNQLEKARIQLEDGRSLSVNDASLCARIAEMQLALGQIDAARVRSEQAVDLDPKLAAAWVVHARVMRARQQLQQALADYHRALDYAPEDRQTLLEVAELYREMCQPQRAIMTLQILSDTYGPGEEPQQVLYLLGLAYEAAQRYDDAADSFATATQRGRPTPELLYRLAEVQLALGRPAAAADAARAAIAMDPRHQPSRDLLGRIEVAQQPTGPMRR
jgi:tetratricopeptide (TPR) repeat protein